MHFHKAQEKPQLWGSFQDRQYAIWRNLEETYGVDHETEALIMPLFWGLPCLDYSKYGNHGVNHGATCKDRSLLFDGADDYIEISNSASLNITEKITISIRFYPINLTAQWQGLLTKRAIDGSQIDYGVVIEGSGNDVCLNITGGDDNHCASGFDVAENEQQHIIATFNEANNVLEIYKNKINILSTTDTGSIQSNNLPVIIGDTGWTGNNQHFSGKIDEVRISNVIYIADQIALFHDRPWDLYRPVSRPIYSIPAAKSISDLSSEIVAIYPTREDLLLLRHDHVPVRNEQNVQTGKAMQFRLYNPDPAFGIDLTTFKLRFDEGSWYRYGDSRLTFTEISYMEYKVYFNPPNFDYNSEIMIEVYCEDHLNNPGIKLEIL